MTIWLPTLWIATGICLFAGLHFLTVGHSKGSAHLFASFGIVCLVVAAYIGASALMQTPDTGLSWIVLERVHVAIGCAIYPTAVWFISLYSRLQRWRGWLVASIVIFGALLVIDLVRPYGLLLSSAEVGPALVLPWGERINRVATTPTPIAFGFYIATLAAFCWAFWRCWALARQGQGRRARSLGVYLVVQVLAVAYAEYATIHALPGPDWDALPFLILVLMISQTLTLELRRNAAALDSSISALNAENARRAQAEARLRHMAYTDATSNLPNRNALGEWLASTLSADPRPYGALVVIDPRRFSIINHTLGHRTGDRLIHEIGQRLSRAVTEGEFVARLSGDEFAVALLASATGNDAAQAQVMARADALRAALAVPLPVSSQAFSVRVCMGVAMFHQAGGDADLLLRQAYAAVHAARQADRDVPTAFTQSMQAQAERKLRLEVDLRAAIENRELELAYQPQFDREGNLVGAEALLRWQHPDFGPLSPVEFVHVAEDTGQMQSLGRLVLHTALAALAALPDDGRFRMAVNISPWQLFHADFLADVRSAIREAAVEPRRVTLEITETAFIHDVPDAVAKLRTLGDMGIHVSIDDFGTGYASVALLKAFPVHELKIDQGFIRDMSISSPDRFVTALIALGKAMHLWVVAEGVEREDQHQALADLGCNAFQGYLFSAPVPLETLARHVERAGARAPDSTTLSRP